MADRYASGTSVPADRSRAEIERTLQRFGADQFMYGWGDGAAVIGFRIAGRAVRLTLPMPDDNDPMIALTPAGRERSASQRQEEFEKEVRRRWRSLAAVIKAKLVAVSDGISSVEREFFADLILPSGQTMLEHVAPQLAEGRLPELMPGAPS